MTTEQILSGLRRARRSQSGIAAVEFVLILPLLALMLFGTIDIGRLLFDYHAVSKSVRDATRYLARIDAATLGLSCTGATGVDAISDAKSLALTGTEDLSADYILGYWTDPGTITISAACVDNTAGTYQGFYSGVDFIPNVTMTATVSFPFLNGWLLDLGDTLTFTISHNETHIGQ